MEYVSISSDYPSIDNSTAQQRCGGCDTSEAVQAVAVYAQDASESSIDDLVDPLFTYDEELSIACPCCSTARSHGRRSSPSAFSACTISSLRRSKYILSSALRSPFSLTCLLSLLVSLGLFLTILTPYFNFVQRHDTIHNIYPALFRNPPNLNLRSGVVAGFGVNSNSQDDRVQSPEAAANLPKRLGGDTQQTERNLQQSMPRDGGAQQRRW